MAGSLTMSSSLGSMLTHTSLPTLRSSKCKGAGGQTEEKGIGGVLAHEPGPPSVPLPLPPRT